ncbi:MAG: acetoacetate--CoA ligase [Alcanivoracaceae bacterium]|nr:acetoacetate--CoA ligase [Alcanivoracaceae bacterium]
MTDILWQPPATHHSDTRLSGFWRQAEQAAGVSLPDWRSLHRWSCDNPERFWPLVWDVCGITGEPGDSVQQRDGAFHQRRFFPGARLNFAENLLQRRDRATAITAEQEDGSQQTLTYAELFQQAGRFAAWLLDNGISAGDRVAGWLPNRAEAMVAALGSAWIGAVWSSCSPDFGISGVLDRFGQIEPAVLLVTDGYQYGGKWIELDARISAVVDALGPCKLVQVTSARSHRIAGATPWEQIQSATTGLPDFCQLPFDHPLFILFSSGTTGKPKCIVHGAGGTLLQHAKEHQLHGDLRRDDTLFYFTTCGWMMWNWLLSGLQAGASLVLYDGNPAWPDSGRLFDMAATLSVTHFGTSAKFIQAVEKSGLQPARQYDLSAMRVLYSTGSPLLHESYDFIYAHISDSVQLSSISGGTDIISCFALGNPLLPVIRGELQCAGLGMDVAVYDQDGQAVIGERGELVCQRPFPSMPTGFWDDDGDKRYHDAYFDRFPDTWAHGDFAELVAHDSHDGLIIHGRSDAVLNPGGVRIGTAEIYRQVETLDEIRESVVVGQDWEGDVRVVLFVVLQPGNTLTEALCQRIRTAIRSGATPRHVPARIIEVPEIPRTVSGKVVELAVRDTIHGRAVQNVSALANPEALGHFSGLEALKH